MYVFFVLSLDTPTGVYKLILYFDIQEMHPFIRFSFFIITNSAYITNNYHKTLLITQISNQFLFFYFQRPFFSADTEFTTFSKSSTIQTQQTKKYAHTEQTFKNRALLGFVRSCELSIQQKGASV